MSVIAIIPPYILNNEILLFRCLEGRLCNLKEELSNEKLREAVMLDYHQWNSNYPDHVPEGLWQAYQQKVGGGKSRGNVIQALKCLYDEYLESQAGGTYVSSSEFGWWQNMLTHISPLPLQAYVEAHSNDERLHLHPYERRVEEYIQKNGLNNAHLHLNLCSDIEEDWLTALADPAVICRELEKESQRKQTVRELIQQIHPQFTPEAFFQHLQAAKAIRCLLIKYTQHRGNGFMLPGDLYRLPLGKWRERHMGGFHLPQPKDQKWMAELLKKLYATPFPDIERIFHVYLLLLHEHRNLNAQNETCVGLRQFQKNADFPRTGVGSVTYYRETFKKLHGNERDSMTNLVSARLSPRADALALKKQIATVLTGYYQYLQCIKSSLSKEKEPLYSDTPISLWDLLELIEKEVNALGSNVRVVNPLLTFHFIKWPYIPGGTKRYSKGLLPEPHYADQRKTYTQEYRVLTDLRKKDGLWQWMVALDAAANEMDTPPHVFAPVFRAAKRSSGHDAESGIKGLHYTFHAGEDFHHLISGIRSVYETIKFLGMEHGDRIGHATALGIQPGFWIKSLPKALALRKGEWLQDLSFYAHASSADVGVRFAN